jgi:ATP-binding cassette subfamily B protein
MKGSDLTKVFGQISRGLPLLPRTVALVWNAAPGWNLAWLILLIAQSMVPVGIVYLTRSLVDGLSAAVGRGLSWDNIGGPIILAAAMGGLTLLGLGLQSLTAWISTIQSETVRDGLARQIHAQSIAIDYRHFEDPDFYDRLHRARVGGAELPLAQAAALGNLLQSGLTLIAMAAVLFRYGPWIPLALLVGTGPTLFVVVRNSRRLYRWSRKSTPAQRRVSYYDWLLTARDNAAEIRQFGLGGYWNAAYERERGVLRTERIALAKRQAAGQFAAGTMGLAAGGAALAWIGRGAMRGALSLGDIALFAQAFNQGQSLIRTLLQNAGQIYTNFLYLGDFFEFLDLKPGVEIRPPESSETAAFAAGAALSGSRALNLRPVGLRFENVSFTYPGSKKTAVQGLSFELEAGKTTAVVGENGAGKSTLIKLITRLHEPGEGRILWNGRDVREFSGSEIRERTTVLLQIPMQYQESAATNVRLGRLDADLEAVQEAARASGAADFIERLPRSYETPLGRMFEGGVDLSTGEWQKLALARALARPVPLLLLDEPTSALDAWAEAEWYTRLRRALGGRTMLLITHRLTTAQRADVICVMSGGRIVESGTHVDLLAAGGRYAHAWAGQTKA